MIPKKHAPDLIPWALT